MNRQHTVFDDLVETARTRGLCVELHDDGVTRGKKTGAEYRVITNVRITNRKTRAIVLQYPAGLGGLDDAARALLPRLPA